jgi:hypothetical protein
VVLQASLINKNVQQIQAIETTQTMTANSPVMVDLFFDGFLIHANGVNGPYTLKDL